MLYYYMSLLFSISTLGQISDFKQKFELPSQVEETSGLLFFNSKIKPNTKWNTTPKIKTGCITYWIKGFVPIKWEVSLNTSALKTDVMFIAKCCNRKNIKKNAESAMATFLAIDEDKSPLIFFEVCLWKQRYYKLSANKNDLFYFLGI